MPRLRNSNRRIIIDTRPRWSYKIRSSNVATEHRPSRQSSRRARIDASQWLENNPDETSEEAPPVPPRKEQAGTDDVEANSENVLKQIETNSIDLVAQSRITELEQQLQAITQEWKKSARELNELQARNEKSNQMNDGTLIERARQLRYAIWTFSIQYFDGDTPPSWRKDAAYFNYLRETTPSSSAFENYLRHPTQRAKVVAAFLWEILRTRVFDQFDWAGKDVGRNIRDLRKFLNAKNCPPSIGKHPPRPEAEREFQMWSTTTIELVLDVLGTRHSKVAEVETHLTDRKKSINYSVKLLFGLEDESQGITEHLESILDDAFALDKIMSQQVARLEWVVDWFALETTDCKFDEKTMDLEEGDSDMVTKEGYKVRLITAPALVKRGRPTGQEFDKERILLKMSVWGE
ncbi:hypothetical protein EDB81DRAFT_110380 [Dactylonectria macrodidyma]|uniref:Uncharacterized protein n=1 Tax=Dactylonectria macrodidyma TaxID=307937 RepID=A0A9P9ISJ7_9HYPO|nr:hypothetical protein EDB81DRAFT_110380 [Dactylonectria macrodidyma]